MKRHILAAAVGVVVTLGAAPAAAQIGPGIGTPMVPTGDETNSRVGTRGANFLEIGLGARAMGMAGAYSAIGEGLSGMYWNLAGVAEVQNIAAGVHFSQLYGKDGLDFVWGAAAFPMGGGAFGIQIGQMSSGDIPLTTYANPEGNDIVAGASFEYTATFAELSYSRRLTDRLAFGLGLKYATEGEQRASASYFGADVGLKFRTGLYGTTIGAALQNAGSSGRFQGNALERAIQRDIIEGQLVRVNLRTEEMEMPTIFRFSILTDLIGGPEALLSQQTDMGSLRAVGEFNQALDTDLQTILGLEYGFRDRVFVRAGKRWLNESLDNADFTSSDKFQRGLAFGGGVRLPVGGRNMAFDYAWNGNGELPNTNHFTFEFGF